MSYDVTELKRLSSTHHYTVKYPTQRISTFIEMYSTIVYRYVFERIYQHERYFPICINLEAYLL